MVQHYCKSIKNVHYVPYCFKVNFQLKTSKKKPVITLYVQYIQGVPKKPNPHKESNLYTLLRIL